MTFQGCGHSPRCQSAKDHEARAGDQNQAFLRGLASLDDFIVTMAHADENLRKAFQVPPNAIPIMAPEEAEPVAWVNDGPWQYPVSHWPGGLRQAKAAARAASERGRPYSLPSVPPSPLPPAERVPVVAREPKPARLPAPSGRQPRENRGPRHLAPQNCPELLARCPICGMEDLPSLLPDDLAEWDGWPAHAGCAEWIGLGQEPQQQEARPVPARTGARSFLVTAALLGVLCAAALLTLSWWVIGALLVVSLLTLARTVRRMVNR